MVRKEGDMVDRIAHGVNRRFLRLSAGRSAPGE
jgi:hypothetical protein